MAFLKQLELGSILRNEFAGYNLAAFRRDLLAGLTVGAVCLPLALAFGVASGATAAAGIVTAILAGIVIGGLGGASFQISGPTGAMSAVLIMLFARYGLQGIWLASLLAGLIMIAMGAFRLGRYISFIPTPVITGFTSGIAIIIAVGQIDNVLGVKHEATENALAHLWHHIALWQQSGAASDLPNWQAVGLALLVMAVMVGLPRLTKSVPGSLVGIIVATIVAQVAGWNVATIGAIPASILLDQRLTFGTISWEHFGDLLAPAISIAALGSIESLLCGTVGATMSGRPFKSNLELIAQGIGNLIIPFFGGVPATAAIARTSVGIKSGGQTRVVSIVHAIVLLLSVFVLGPWIGRIPLAALGGVLMVTAWRMNEWESIHFFARTRLRHALAGMTITMLATAALDLTQAILIGLAISALLYVRQSANSMQVASSKVDVDRLRDLGHELNGACPSMHVYYVTGPVFFGSAHAVLEAFETAADYHSIIISMRGVPLVDIMGAEIFHQIIEEHHARKGTVYFVGLQNNVRALFNRTGITKLVGEDHFLWDASDAIMAAHEDHFTLGCSHCDRYQSNCELVQLSQRVIERRKAKAGQNTTVPLAEEVGV